MAHLRQRYGYIRNTQPEKAACARFVQCIFSGSMGIYGLSVNEECTAIGLLRRLPWDSDIFHTPMGSIEIMAAQGTNNDITRESCVELIQRVLECARGYGLRHVSCRINNPDWRIVHALERTGFHLMDIIVSYVYKKEKEYLPKFKRLYRIRFAREDDQDSLKILAETGFSHDRFHNDPDLRDKDCKKLFRHWLIEALRQPSDSSALVAVDAEEKARGFLIYKKDNLAGKLFALKIIGRGLSVVSPEAKGAYVALLEEVRKQVCARYDYAEFDTQLTNREVIRIWHAFGFKYSHMACSFHKSLASS